MSDPAALPSAAPKEALTPLMKQYEELKARHPEEILLFRLGDFYEIFGEDARRAAPVLEVALTQRQGVPMCGVPYHAMNRYVSRLLKRNWRVAIAEQLEDPAAAKTLVRRDIIRVLTPGTLVEENLLNERKNNFLVALEIGARSGSAGPGSTLEVGLAAIDISTGQFLLSALEDDAHFSALSNEVLRLEPAEVLWRGRTDPPSAFEGIAVRRTEAKEPARALEDLLPDPERARALNAFAHSPLTLEAARAALAYVRKMNPAALQTLEAPRWIALQESIRLDREAVESLELLRNSDDGSARGSLFDFLDRTLTPMGARLLRQWIVRPLARLDAIRARADAVDFFVEDAGLCQDLRRELQGSADIQRILVRAASGQAGPRDLIALKFSLAKLEKVKARLAEELAGEGDGAPSRLSQILTRSADFTGLAHLIQTALVDDPPIHLDETGVLREGYHAGLDEIRSASQEGKEWLQALEAREKSATQIPTLKIGYTSVFGYYFEVTKPHLSKVPPAWHRKQTLVNAERFISEELKTLEQKILGAEEKALRLEKELFREIVERVREAGPALQKAADALAELDCTLSLAEVAESQGFVRPKMEDSDVIAISEGWHPVVKGSLPAGTFVPNDVLLNGSDSQIIILTGPNMSGKSTYLRQTALIVLLAQMGSFVPARQARIGIVDGIFTRIGSGDRLAQGQSTFMVEMRETAHILSRVTSRSLVILDEVGRGTSTYDGISIAWAVIEHWTRSARPRVLFATHYFELTGLAREYPCIQNYNVQAKEWKDTVVFLHKIAPGPADRSYGIHVAQLAGLPGSVVERAKKILLELETEHQSLLQSKQKGQPELPFS